MDDTKADKKLKRFQYFEIVNNRKMQKNDNVVKKRNKRKYEKRKVHTDNEKEEKKNTVRKLNFEKRKEKREKERNKERDRERERENVQEFLQLECISVYR